MSMRSSASSPSIIPAHARLRALGALWATLTAMVTIGLAVAGPAWADGDPASDVLSAQTAFLPPDADPSAAQISQLSSVIAAARAAAFPLRVAVIASPADLGSITQLWRRPQQYAEFLDEELSQVAPGRVLVVMPGDGFGLAAPGVTPAADLALLSRAAAPRPGRDLATVAIRAVLNLAAAAGHPIGPGSLRAAPGGGAATAAGGGGDPAALIVLVAGAVLIAAAWTASLRARPLGRPEQPA